MSRPPKPSTSSRPPALAAGPSEPGTPDTRAPDTRALDAGAFDGGPTGLWEELARPTPTPVPTWEGPPPGLPEPVRRYLELALDPGAPLLHAVELRMTGRIRLRAERPPVPLEAIQILRPPEGFVWSARTTGGWLRIRGWDAWGRGLGGMRWRLFGRVPVVNTTGSDVTRSVAGRLAMEAALVPSILLPSRGLVRWEPDSERRARFSLVVGPEAVHTTLEVDSDGWPTRLSALRWREGGYQRFDVLTSGRLETGHGRLPARIVAGWRLGEPDEERFFEVELTRARFL
ncbi:MAG: hypothetical protein EA352_05100 [Gemmatimonadales bacterium]|nr:MAG: hypothetical protein EA352_05100 [Gemmatimonadales bacterium]